MLDMHEVISSSLTAPTIAKGTAKCSPFYYGGDVVSEVQYSSAHKFATERLRVIYVRQRRADAIDVPRKKNSIKMISTIFVE